MKLRRYSKLLISLLSAVFYLSPVNASTQNTASYISETPDSTHGLPDVTVINYANIVIPTIYYGETYVIGTLTSISDIIFYKKTVISGNATFGVSGRQPHGGNISFNGESYFWGTVNVSINYGSNRGVFNLNDDVLISGRFNLKAGNVFINGETNVTGRIYCEESGYNSRSITVNSGSHFIVDKTGAIESYGAWANGFSINVKKGSRFTLHGIVEFDKYGTSDGGNSIRLEAGSQGYITGTINLNSGVRYQNGVVRSNNLEIYGDAIIEASARIMAGSYSYITLGGNTAVKGIIDGYATIVGNVHLHEGASINGLSVNGDNGVLTTSASTIANIESINNSGIINLRGGELSTTIRGGIVNAYGKVDAKLQPLSVSGSTIWNNYGIIDGDISLSSKSDLNAIITEENLAQTLFTGKITGKSSLDVSFHQNIDLGLIVGTETAVYDDSINSISLNLINSDHVSGVRAEGNKVIVDNLLVISNAETGLAATISRDAVSKKTAMMVTSGSFDIHEGETQTFDSINTREGSFVRVLGGVLKLATKATLQNDDATSGLVQSNGVIESTDIVQLSEGRISVAAGKKLELKAAISLGKNTTTALGSSDSQLVLQKQVDIEQGASLTLIGHVSGDAHVRGAGKGSSSLSYTGVYSPGNSPAAITISDVAVTYDTLDMEIFGMEGAGVEGGHDKLSFTNADVSFNGLIMLNVMDTQALADLANAQDGIITISLDLFDFDSASTVDATLSSIGLLYDNNLAHITADASQLFATGEVIFVVDTQNIPEPCTTSLSLLALAGFLARRRRAIKAS